MADQDRMLLRMEHSRRVGGAAFLHASRFSWVNRSPADSHATAIPRGKPFSATGSSHLYVLDFRELPGDDVFILAQDVA